MKRIIASIALASFTALGVVCSGPPSTPAASPTPAETTAAPASTTLAAMAEHDAVSTAVVSSEASPVYTDDLEFLPPKFVAASQPQRTAYGQQFSACSGNNCGPAMGNGRVRIFGRRGR